MSRPAFPEELLTASQFAERAGVTPQALTNWVTRGEGPRRGSVPEPWLKVGRVVLYHVDDVDAFIAERDAALGITAERLRERAAEMLRRADQLEGR